MSIKYKTKNSVFDLFGFYFGSNYVFPSFASLKYQIYFELILFLKLNIYALKLKIIILFITHPT